MSEIRSCSSPLSFAEEYREDKECIETCDRSSFLRGGITTAKGLRDYAQGMLVAELES